MSLDRPWLKSYPEEVPHTIDADRYASIVAVFQDSCERYRNLPAYSNFGKTISFADLDRLSERFAAYLLCELKMKKGDRIALMMPNLLQYPIAIFGALRAGLTVVNTNPMYTARELRHQLSDSGASAIVVLEHFAHTVAEVLEHTPIRHVVIASVGEMLGFPKGPLIDFTLRYVKKAVPEYRIDGAMRFSQALKLGARHQLPDVVVRAEDIAFLQYTGGTTGVAKGAMLTHRNLVANMEQSAAVFALRAEPGQEVVITALPLYHIFALTVNCMIFTKLGGHNILITNPRAKCRSRSCPVSTPCTTACSTRPASTSWISPTSRPRWAVAWPYNAPSPIAG